MITEPELGRIFNPAAWVKLIEGPKQNELDAARKLIEHPRELAALPCGHHDYDEVNKANGELAAELAQARERVKVLEADVSRFEKIEVQYLDVQRQSEERVKELEAQLHAVDVHRQEVCRRLQASNEREARMVEALRKVPTCSGELCVERGCGCPGMIARRALAAAPSVQKSERK